MRKSIFLLFALAFLSSSCERILDTEPQTSISDENVIVDEKSALAALIGVYDGLQAYAASNIIALELAGDNVVNFNRQNDIVANKTAGSGSGAFGAVYANINRANFVIQNVSAINDDVIASAAKSQILGEAYFLRALGYFDLVKMYGGVPIVLEAATSPTSHSGVRKSPREAVYRQVLADLNLAENLLTAESNRNRANKNTVYALKARLYLYTEQWELAEEFATKTIASNEYRLVTPYSSFFNNKNTQESIFELTFTNSDPSSFYTNWRSPAQGGRHDYIPERSFVGEILDPDRGGTRSDLLFRTPEGIYDLIQYGNQDGTSAIFILRIAEQYLIRAEARAKKPQPDLSGAIADLNLIKERAEVPLFTQSAGTTSSAVLLAIENERRFELPFEGHRFLDIVRTGRAAEVFGAINPNLKNPNHWIFPIPQSEIVRDPDLEQNEGY